MISGWLAFWDKPHSIYVSSRHKDVHYRLVAGDIAALVPSSTARVLDYGCGEALHADRIASACAELLLCDGAPSVRAGLAERFAANPKIRVLSTDDVVTLPDRALDLIVLHSVAQYLTPAETDLLLVLFRRLLNPEGALIVSDVLPPHLSAAMDAAALLRFAVPNGFLGAALVGLARTLVSNYRRTRARFGLTRYSETAMIEKLTAAGFSARRMDKTIGHNQARMAFTARPR